MKIPLFPLKLVIFPGARYPLHIFEERYKKLINRCLRDDDGFGIAAKTDDDISSVGCYVRVTKILKKYDNGNLDIIVMGLYRFKLLTAEENSDGYLIAEIEEFSDTGTGVTAEDLSQEAISQFQELISKTDLTLSESFWKNLVTTKRKSFKLAEKSGLDIKQQQKMLGMQNENERLEFLLEHFLNISKYLDRSETLKDIIAGDGYLNE